MKNNIAIKLFFYCALTSIVWFMYKSLTDMKYMNYIVNNQNGFWDKKNINSEVKQEHFSASVASVTKSENKSELKYILQWTSPKTIPFVYMGVGRQGFVDRKCAYTNCFVTSNRSFFEDYTKFDVILFHGPEVRYLHGYGFYNKLPDKRSLHQKFAFASIESSDHYPMCSDTFNNFFNWTWTYRLDSDARWGYMVIRDMKNNIIGPNKDMNWINVDDMEPVSEDLRKKLANKTKAAAWFVSNCDTKSRREIFVHKLRRALSLYKLKVDIYGKCGTMSCPREAEHCDKMIEQDYYFYLSFENSFAEDYVTEKLLHGLRNYAVPIVYGGANYTRFMPDGIYLNARKLGPEMLAMKMNELIQNPDLYSEYFRWRSHYSYHHKSESIETDDYCGFCSLLNNDSLVKKTTIYKNFKDWWDPPNACKYKRRYFAEIHDLEGTRRLLCYNPHQIYDIECELEPVIIVGQPVDVGGGLFWVGLYECVCSVVDWFGVSPGDTRRVFVFDADYRKEIFWFLIHMNNEH